MQKRRYRLPYTSRSRNPLPIYKTKGAVFHKYILYPVYKDVDKIPDRITVKGVTYDIEHPHTLNLTTEYSLENLFDDSNKEQLDILAQIFDISEQRYFVPKGYNREDNTAIFTDGSKGKVPIMLEVFDIKVLLNFILGQLDNPVYLIIIDTKKLCTSKVINCI